MDRGGEPGLLERAGDVGAGVLELAVELDVLLLFFEFAPLLFSASPVGVFATHWWLYNKYE